MKNRSKNSSLGFTGTLFTAAWLLCIGYFGFYLGSMQAIRNGTPCPVKVVPLASNSMEVGPLSVQKDCEPQQLQNDGISHASNAFMEDLKDEWTCSKLDLDKAGQPGSFVENIGDTEMLRKTKWKNIINVSPKAFFDKYLTQYPGNIASSQPVTVFSHIPLANFEEIEQSCKLVDIALIPDTHDTCVVVTETFHDVASYHMLHAEKVGTDDFSMTSNHIEGQNLPSESNYIAARTLFSTFFDHGVYIANAIKGIQQVRAAPYTVVATVVETVEELELFKNSVYSAVSRGMPKSNFMMFTTSNEVQLAANNIGCKLFYMSKLRDVGLFPLLHATDEKINNILRRDFLQVLFAFSVSNKGFRVLWQNPGTYWNKQSPAQTVLDLKLDKKLDSFWAYGGRDDPRAGPFFASFDFAGFGVSERSIHMLHEIMLHFDLVLAWESLDAVSSYRLSENNARYGTSSYLAPPYIVLHTNMVHNEASLLAGAMGAEDPPLVVVPPSRLPPSTVKAMLQQANLWHL